MTTTQNVETPTQFSDVVRTATFSDHETAAMSGFMTALLDKTLPVEAYAGMVAQHWFAYVALEKAGDALADHPVAGRFVWEELRRLPALEADLRLLIGEDWRARITPSASTRGYCERMDEVCVAHPERFVAHHYTRYMGDLSGGQMIGRIARDAYGFEFGAGAAFYEFPGIDDIGAFKDEYRRRLDAAPWSDDEQAALLEEVVIAYRHNTDVFDDLDREFSRDGS